MSSRGGLHLNQGLVVVTRKIQTTLMNFIQIYVM